MAVAWLKQLAGEIGGAWSACAEVLPRTVSLHKRGMHPRPPPQAVDSYGDPHRCKTSGHWLPLCTSMLTRLNRLTTPTLTHRVQAPATQQEKHGHRTRTQMHTWLQASANLWMNVSSVGDAGASCLGYFGGVFSPDGRFIMAHGFTGVISVGVKHGRGGVPAGGSGLDVWECCMGFTGAIQEQRCRCHAGCTSPLPASLTPQTCAACTLPGALHLWERHAPEAAAGGRPVRHAAASWTPRHALGGHWDAVSDCQWGIDGGCVASVSEDQTARIFTAVAMPEGSDAASQEAQGQGHWCEIARPQVREGSRRGL